MNSKTASKQLVVAVLLRILVLNENTIFAVVSPSQYSSYLPQSYYTQSVFSYGNENQNYFNNSGEISSANEYSREPYQRQPYPLTSYGSSTSSGTSNTDDYDDVDQNSYHPQQTSYRDDFNEKYSTFKQEQEQALNSYLQDYQTRYSANKEGSSFYPPYDNTDSNNSEAMNYQRGEDILYPPSDSALHQHHYHQPKQHHYPTERNNMAPSSRVNFIQPTPYHMDDRAVTPKDNVFASNTHITTSLGRPLRATYPNANHHEDSKSNIESGENQQQRQQDLQQQQQLFARATHLQPPTTLSHVDISETDRPLDRSPSRTYYVADSDLTDANNSIHPPSNSAQTLSLFKSHLIQFPTVSSVVQQHPPPSITIPIPSEPIPISKHVEITKHIPVPIYKQVHIPFRKPVHIEIPRPVISTVSRPYPIQVQSITKTVAVPMVKEVKIPIEKIAPYPVEHKVPYVVEKRVPFQVEKQVASPVYYPFPVRVPVVRTIVHKKKAAHFPLLRYHHHPLHHSHIHPKLHI